MKLLVVLLLILQLTYSSEYSDKEIGKIVELTASRVSNYVSSNYESYIHKLKKELLAINEANKKELIILTNEFNRMNSIKDQKHLLELKSLEVKWRNKCNKTFLGGIAAGGGISLGVSIIANGFEFTPISIKF